MSGSFLIYPLVKRSIRFLSLLAALCFCLLFLSQIFIPLCSGTDHATHLLTFSRLTLSITLMASLTPLLPWATHVLIDARFSPVIRLLSYLPLLPFLYTLPVLICHATLSEKLIETEHVLNAYFLIVAFIGFFSYPRTKGYPPRGRFLLLAFSVLAALYSILFPITLILLTFLNSSAVLSFYLLEELSLSLSGLLLTLRLARYAPDITTLPETQQTDT